MLEPEIGEIFRQGEVWLSPRGNLYRVIQPTAGYQVMLQKGLKIGRGRRIFRQADHVFGWTRMSEEALAAHLTKWGLKP